MISLPELSGDLFITKPFNRQDSWISEPSILQTLNESSLNLWPLS